MLGNAEVVQQYGGIEGIPTTFIMDKKGNIVEHQVGMLTNGMLEQKIKVLLRYRRSWLKRNVSCNAKLPIP